MNALAGVSGAPARRVEALILGEVRSLGGAAEALPFRIRDRADRHVAVERLEDQVGPGSGVTGGRLAAHHRVLHHRFRPEIGDHDVEHGDLDVLACAALLARIEGRGDSLRRHHRGGLVGDDGADHLRSPRLGIGLNIGEARQTLDDRIINALLRIGAVVAGAANRDVDEARIERPHGALAETDPLHHPRTEVLHENIGAGDQPAQDLRALRLLEIEGDRPLAAVGRNEQGRELAGRVDRLAATPRDVSAERLNLDDVGALVRQEHGGEWAGHHAREVDHLNAGQRTRHACSRVSFRHL